MKFIGRDTLCVFFHLGGRLHPHNFGLNLCFGQTPGVVLFPNTNGTLNAQRPKIINKNDQGNLTWSHCMDIVDRLPTCTFIPFNIDVDFKAKHS